LFHSFGRLNCKYCLHFISLRFYTILLALRCLQLSLMIGWRSTLLYMVSKIQVKCLVVSNMLFGSMAKLFLRFSMCSMLGLYRRLMFLIDKMTSSMVIVLALKSSMIPNSFMVSGPRMRSHCGLQFFSYSTTLGPEWYLLLSE
jgi:hypothetical protein